MPASFIRPAFVAAAACPDRFRGRTFRSDIGALPTPVICALRIPNDSAGPNGASRLFLPFSLPLRSQLYVQVQFVCAQGLSLIPPTLIYTQAVIIRKCMIRFASAIKSSSLQMIRVEITVWNYPSHAFTQSTISNNGPKETSWYFSLSSNAGLFGITRRDPS
jgi:hypothetical protein